jgi:hypothetical protein
MQPILAEGGNNSKLNLIEKQAVMAGRILNRRELRKQTEQAEQAKAGVVDRVA